MFEHAVEGKIGSTPPPLCRKTKYALAQARAFIATANTCFASQSLLSGCRDRCFTRTNRNPCTVGGLKGVAFEQIKTQYSRHTLALCNYYDVSYVQRLNHACRAIIYQSKYSVIYTHGRRQTLSRTRSTHIMTPLTPLLFRRMTFINRSATCCFPFSHRCIFFRLLVFFFPSFFFYMNTRNTKRTYLYSFLLRVPSLLSRCICL